MGRRCTCRRHTGPQRRTRRRFRRPPMAAAPKMAPLTRRMMPGQRSPQWRKSMVALRSLEAPWARADAGSAAGAGSSSWARRAVAVTPQESHPRGSQEALARWMLEQDATAMLTRIDRVKPFALQETMLPAAALMPATLIAIERHLIDDRRRLRRQVQAYLHWLRVEGRTAPLA